MIIYYAPGGGLGHLTRARAVIHTLNLQDVAIITASPFADDKRVLGDIEVIRIPEDFEKDTESYRFWLQTVFQANRPTEIFIDTFPGGIVGEFCDFDFKDVKLSHVARALRFNYYRVVLHGSLPRFDMVYKVEQLPTEQDEFLLQHSKALQFLKLEDPESEEANELINSATAEVLTNPIVSQKEVWLIVHSDSGPETSKLLALAHSQARAEATKPRIIVITTGKPQLACEYIDFYPASALFPIVSRIFTGCGFNAMRQTEAYAEKHYFIPFVRPYDDQQRRADLRTKEQHGKQSFRISAGFPSSSRF